MSPDAALICEELGHAFGAATSTNADRITIIRGSDERGEFFQTNFFHRAEVLKTTPQALMFGPAFRIMVDPMFENMSDTAKFMQAGHLFVAGGTTVLNLWPDDFETYKSAPVPLAYMRAGMILAIGLRPVLASMAPAMAHLFEYQNGQALDPEPLRDMAAPFLEMMKLAHADHLFKDVESVTNIIASVAAILAQEAA